VRNMESASSANEGASRRIFDSILDPCESESESQLGSTRDRATSGRRQESRESVHSILKRLDKGPRGKAFRFSGEWSISNTNFESGACRAQDFQEHVQKRLVTTIPYTSINYIIFSYRRGDMLLQPSAACRESHRSPRYIRTITLRKLNSRKWSSPSSPSLRF
jgi:hypothetical protein